MRELGHLTSTLRRIDGKGYRAYRDIEGAYATADYELYIDRVQGDPFAAPSRVRVIVPHESAGSEARWLTTAARRTALADLVARRFARAAADVERRRGSGKSGLVAIDAPGQEVLERTACRVTGSAIELRFSVGLPAAGRRVLAREAEALLLDDVPEIVDEAAFADRYDAALVDRHLESVEDQRALRAQLDEKGLVAFIGDGSLLPRFSGVDARAMPAAEAVAFAAPDALAVTLETPNRGAVRGLGVPRGVTLIVGGGYHGKSTLLNAIALGIYDHVLGDGRERCVSHPGVVTIRAEDGRRVAGVDISPFIDNLPGGRDTRRFSSDDASGSTSQAANVIEAIEAGATALLIDEDTAATNFMIRDRRMQLLIDKDHEPITPFVDKVRLLADERGISTILVIGGSGDYFDVADRVIAMDAYHPKDVTAHAKAIAASPTGRSPEGGDRFGNVRERRPVAASVDPAKGRRAVKIGVRDRRTIELGEERIDVSAVSQLACTSQLRAIGHALALARRYMDGRRTIAGVLDAVERELAETGLDALSRAPVHDFAELRRYELAAALNRLRTLRVESS